ncbi:MAG: YraN family protein [Proteobacteria bacterium]|nr:YraN family protein [Pseudomonadota bacterium]MBU4471745.1 YraN family protein [Pseudomonadota bacterium]MCG2750526.1 YraN family protein [Desulfobacteraceae bacterium]
MLNPHQQFGKESEVMAAAYLKRQGYRILETNYKNQLGEIDIIAKDMGILTFIEVKARRSDRFGNPKYAVTRKKQVRISRVALSYLKASRQMDKRARFDVVVITRTSNINIELVKNAFELILT